AARLPERLVPARVGGSGEDEEQVGETVQVDEGERVYLSDPERRDLGPAAHGPGDVQLSRRLAPAGKDEAPEGRQLLVERIAEPLELVDPTLLDAKLPVAGHMRHGDVGAEVEELVLDLHEGSAQLVGKLARKGDAELRVQLVDHAVCHHPRVGL